MNHQYEGTLARRPPSTRSNWCSWTVAALAGAVLAFFPIAPLALACDGCDSHDKCVHGLDQGTYGCSSGEVQCSITAKIFFGCGGRWCNTSELICDGKKPAIRATSNSSGKGLCGSG